MIADTAVRTVFGRPQQQRSSPARDIRDEIRSDAQRSLAARLMRVNHAGEVCAQALYQGQALTARATGVRDALERAAEEENDHLAWCAQRLDELDARPSRLNPLWYLGSFCIGAASGLVGDRFNLGFLAETERQVVQHLDRHLERLPSEDPVSRAILEQMKQDEAGHATTALHAGATELPSIVKKMMTVASRLMTTVSERF